MIWLTSDHHFDHAGIIEHCKRPFANVDEMNETMIARWNERVAPTDEVYYLGDFTMRNSPALATEQMNRLHGTINFLRGNHDIWMKKFQFDRRRTFIGDLGKIRYNGKRIIICHYPIWSWESKEKGYLHCYGHSHGASRNAIPHSMDVGVDTNNFYPYSIDEVIERLK